MAGHQRAARVGVSRRVESPVSPPSLDRAPRSVRILGIDPGSQITGYGIVDVVGGRTTAVEWGSIRSGGEHSERLRNIFVALGRVVREFQPAEIAIERVFLTAMPIAR